MSNKITCWWCERWFKVAFHYLNKILSTHLEGKTSHMDAMKWQGRALDRSWRSRYARTQYKYHRWMSGKSHRNRGETSPTCPHSMCIRQCEELLTLWGGSPGSSLEKPRSPYPLPWINVLTSAGKHLDVSTNVHRSPRALIIPSLFKR